ncbi:MAG: proton-conducting transporter membrane subunit, partial [Rhodopirellula sp. JB053]
MIELAAMLLAVPVLCLVAFSCLPSRYANDQVRLLRRFVPCVLGGQAVIAFAAVVFIATSGEPLSVSFIELSEGYGIGLGVYIDGVSGLMLSMVSIVSFVASRFSIRYLDGEAMQGRYFRWLGFTSGAVSLMVIAGNLLLFFVAWVMTSFGLHQLLLHYRHRGAAHRAAWSKFTISRIGDAFLIAALILTFKNFGTFDMASLLQQAGELAGGTQIDASYVAAGWLIVLG